MKLILWLTLENKTSMVSDNVLEWERTRLHLLKFWSLVEGKFFSAGLDEDWVRIMIGWDGQKQQEEYFEERESKSLSQYTVVPSYWTILGIPWISNAVICNFHLPGQESSGIGKLC